MTLRLPPNVENTIFCFSKFHYYQSIFFRNTLESLLISFSSALVTYNLKYRAMSISYLPERGTLCMHWWRGLSLDCKKIDRGNDSYGSTLTPLGIVAPTFSQTKYDDNFTRLGRAAISQKQSHTKGFASSFADSLVHSLIKSILKSVRVSVCNFCWISKL